MVHTHQSACRFATLGAGGVMHGHASLVLVDRCHLGMKADEVTDLALESLGDHTDLPIRSIGYPCYGYGKSGKSAAGSNPRRFHQRHWA